MAIAAHGYCACATSGSIDIAAHDAEVVDAEIADAAVLTHDAPDVSSGDDSDACNACPSDALCVAGVCVCGASFTLCAGACVDTTNDQNNCGACASSCSGTAQCVDSSCKTAPTQSIIFVSSKVYAGGSLAGLSGADAICQNLAAAASLGTSSTFKAWLSDGSSDAASRFAHWATHYVLADLTTQVATDWTALTSGTLSHSISLTESLGSPPTGTMASGAVWTNTNPSGSKYSATDCSNWTSTKAMVSSFHFGQATASTNAWTLDPSGTYTGNFCSDTAALYCIGE